MNLRFEGQELRFRISKKELESLCSGSVLKQRTYLPNNSILDITIEVDESTGDAVNHLNKIMYLDNNNCISLCINKKSIVELYQSLPSRDGLETKQIINNEHSLTLILEVDIRTQKRKNSKTNNIENNGS